jgi:hypothetical protein
MITKQQYRKLMNNYQETGNVTNSALRADLSRKKAQKAQRGQPQTKEVRFRSARKENSPPLQGWVMVPEDKASPVRDESSVVPDGTCRACLAG